MEQKRSSILVMFVAIASVSIVVVVGLLANLRAQIDQIPELPFGLRYSKGQTVQPIYEGWMENKDGTFTMTFSYLNRNYVEELSVPIGPNNKIEPGGPDRGQPTFFYTRLHRRAFSITVPKDWGKKEVVWTLTTQGKTQTAIGWLSSDWTIIGENEDRGGDAVEQKAVVNKPPAITSVEPVAPVTLPGAATIKLNVTDDGLPNKPPPPQPSIVGRTGSNTAPILQPGPGTVDDPPNNVPEIPMRGGGGGGRGRGRGGTLPRVQVTYIVYRGPANVTFDRNPTIAEKGVATTTVKFSVPGTYVLRATATDTEMVTEVPKEVTVVVNGPPASANRP